MVTSGAGTLGGGLVQGEPCFPRQSDPILCMYMCIRMHMCMCMRMCMCRWCVCVCVSVCVFYSFLRKHPHGNPNLRHSRCW